MPATRFRQGTEAKNLQWEKLCGNSPQVNIFISNTDLVIRSLCKRFSLLSLMSHTNVLDLIIYGQ